MICKELSTARPQLTNLYVSLRTLHQASCRSQHLLRLKSFRTTPLIVAPVLFRTDHQRCHGMEDKRTILVVEDDESIRHQLGLLLSEDFEVLVAVDGLQAISCYEKNAGRISAVV